MGDFNLSKLVEGTLLSTLSSNNPRWLAPEMIKGAAATLQVDVYSFGIIMWQVASPWPIHVILMRSFARGTEV